MHQVRMRPAVTSALSEGQMSVALVVDPLRGETLNRRREKPCIIRHSDTLGFFSDVNHRLLILDMRPFKSNLVAVHVETFDVLPERQLLVAHFEQRAFDCKRRSILGDQPILDAARSEAGYVFRFAAHESEAGAHGMRRVMHGWKAFPVAGPARHLLLVGPAHELDAPQPAAIPQLADV